MADARKLFPGPHKLYGGIVVGEAYRVDQDRKVAGMPFAPATSVHGAWAARRRY